MDDDSYCGSQSGFGYDFGQYDTKMIVLRPLFAQTPLEIAFVVVKPKVPGDQKLFERVCYMLKLKVVKFQLPTLNCFRAVLRKNSWGGKFSKIGLRKMMP